MHHRLTITFSLIILFSILYTQINHIIFFTLTIIIASFIFNKHRGLLHDGSFMLKDHRRITFSPTRCLFKWKLVKVHTTFFTFRGKTFPILSLVFFQFLLFNGRERCIMLLTRSKNIHKFVLAQF